MTYTLLYLLGEIETTTFSRNRRSCKYVTTFIKVVLTLVGDIDGSVFFICIYFSNDGGALYLSIIWTSLNGVYYYL